MTDFVLPVLGLGSESSPGHTVIWRDGTIICRGILGDLEETRARIAACEAEQQRKEELRNRDVVILDDHR